LKKEAGFTWISSYYVIMEILIANEGLKTPTKFQVDRSNGLKVTVIGRLENLTKFQDGHPRPPSWILAKYEKNGNYSPWVHENAHQISVGSAKRFKTYIYLKCFINPRWRPWAAILDFSKTFKLL
jgi:hypothetical protein